MTQTNQPHTAPALEPAPELQELTIIHNIDRTKHTFKVMDPARLTRAEFTQICEEMNIQAAFINGKYYEL